MHTPGLHDIVCMYSCILVQWVLCFVLNVIKYIVSVLLHRLTQTQKNVYIFFNSMMIGGL